MTRAVVIALGVIVLIVLARRRPILVDDRDWLSDRWQTDGTWHDPHLDDLQAW